MQLRDTLDVRRGNHVSERFTSNQVDEHKIGWIDEALLLPTLKNEFPIRASYPQDTVDGIEDGQEMRT